MFRARRACRAQLIGPLCITAALLTGCGTPGTSPGAVPAWRVVSSPHPGVSSALADIAVGSGSNIWATGSYDRHEGDGSPPPLMEHFDGVSWHRVPVPGAVGLNNGNKYGYEYVDLLSVATAGNRAWAVGDGCPAECYTSGTNFQPWIDQWNGKTWSIADSADPNADFPDKGSHLTDVAAVTPDDVWAVGYACTDSCGSQDFPEVYEALTEHWDGAQWQLVDSAYPDVADAQFLDDPLAVAGSSPTDVWAVGNYCTGTCDGTHGTLWAFIEHFDGRSWRATPAPHPPDSSLADVAVISARDAWAVGDSAGHALVEHWNGRVWSLVTGVGLKGGSLVSVAAVSPADIWVVDDKSLLEQYRGGRWHTVKPAGGSRVLLSSLAAGPDGQLWAVGKVSPPAGSDSKALIEECTGC